MDISRGELVESDLDCLINRRGEQRRQTEGERAREQLWVVSVRRYNARLGDERRLERLAYHEGQARRLSNTLEALVAYHLSEAEKYRQNGHQRGEESSPLENSA